MGDGGAGGFLTAGSGDPETDREDETLLTDCGLGEAAFFIFLGSGVLETLLMGLVLGDGDCLLWGDEDAPLRTGGGLEEV